MGTMTSQITSLTLVYSTVYSSADQRKHQSSAPLAFVRGIHRGPVNSPHKWPVTRQMFPFDDVIMVRQKETLGALHDWPLVVVTGDSRTRGPTMRKNVPIPCKDIRKSRLCNVWTSTASPIYFTTPAQREVLILPGWFFTRESEKYFTYQTNFLNYFVPRWCLWLWYHTGHITQYTSVKVWVDILVISGLFWKRSPSVWGPVLAFGSLPPVWDFIITNAFYSERLWSQTVIYLEMATLSFDRCLLNRLFRRRSKITSKLRVNVHCAGNSPVTGEFPAQMASNAENVSIWWRHHEVNCIGYVSVLSTISIAKRQPKNIFINGVILILNEFPLNAVLYFDNFALFEIIPRFAFGKTWSIPLNPQMIIVLYQQNEAKNIKVCIFMEYTVHPSQAKKMWWNLIYEERWQPWLK